MKNAKDLGFVTGHGFSRACPGLKSGALFSRTHNIVILSGAPHGPTACQSACGAESKDPDDAFLTYIAWGFSTTKLENGLCCDRALVVEKLRAAWVIKAASGSFDSAPQAL